jgi:hypothetical protein
MTRAALIKLMPSMRSSPRPAELLNAGAYSEAEYIVGIIQTDLAEIGYVPVGSTWLRPGEVPPVDWHVYSEVIRWCRKASQDNPLL